MKKFLVFLLVIALTAVIAISGTVAYLTDRENETNVFTMGDVAIELTGNFQQGAELMPGVDVEMKPLITNTGDNAAWVWMSYAIPAKLNKVGSAGENPLHFNFAGRTWQGYHENAAYWAEGQTAPLPEDQLWMVQQTDFKPADQFETIIIHGQEYHLYTNLYYKPLQPGQTTSENLVKVYLDPHIDVDPNGGWHWVEDGVSTDLNWDSEDDGIPMIYVNAYAIQVLPFPNVITAHAAFSGQWGDKAANYAVPSTVAEVANDDQLAAAISAGDTIIKLRAGTYHMPAVAKGKALTITGTHDSVIEVVPAGQGEAGGQLDYNLDGAHITFNGVTIKTNSQLYAGYARLNAVYNDCVIQNTYNLSTGTSVFNNCTFNITNEYLRVGGAASATFNGCTFNTIGRAILVYQDGTQVAQTVTVKDCTFNASAAAYTWNGIHVAAVSIDGTNGTYVVNLEGTNTVDPDFNGLWQIKTGAANVTVNE